MNSYSLIVGDWSHDGHGQTETYFIDTDASLHDISEAYDAGVTIFGVNIMHEFENYEQCEITEELYTAIQTHLPKLASDWCLEGEYTAETVEGMHPDAYVDLYLAIVKLGNPNISISRAFPKSLSIGGYGLFCV